MPGVSSAGWGAKRAAAINREAWSLSAFIPDPKRCAAKCERTINTDGCCKTGCWQAVSFGWTQRPGHQPPPCITVKVADTGVFNNLSGGEGWVMEGHRLHNRVTGGQATAVLKCWGVPSVNQRLSVYSARWGRFNFAGGNTACGFKICVKEGKCLLWWFEDKSRR